MLVSKNIYEIRILKFEIIDHYIIDKLFIDFIYNVNSFN
jgi:hypothetical protein